MKKCEDANRVEHEKLKTKLTNLEICLLTMECGGIRKVIIPISCLRYRKKNQIKLMLEKISLIFSILGKHYLYRYLLSYLWYSEKANLIKEELQFCVNREKG